MHQFKEISKDYIHFSFFLFISGFREHTEVIRREKIYPCNLHNSIQVYYIFTLHFKYIKFESRSHLLLFSRILFMAKVMDIFSKYSRSNVFSEIPILSDQTIT